MVCRCSEDHDAADVIHEEVQLLHEKPDADHEEEQSRQLKYETVKIVTATVLILDLISAPRRHESYVY
eukprot:9604-Heterococcus_DN1.PRE.17